MAEHSKVCKMRLTASIAEKRIHELSKSSSNVIWSGHCTERSEERGINFNDALHIMRTGHVVGTPEEGKYPGEWKCKIIRNLRGNRDAGVVVVILTKIGKLKVKTVEWEDLS
ncbi:MAG: DUF4258 domain-containing protein [Bdellovibrionales bacterium]